MTSADKAHDLLTHYLRPQDIPLAGHDFHAALRAKTEEAVNWANENMLPGDKLDIDFEEKGGRSVIHMTIRRRRAW